jgi:uncharacterized protein YbgA (DUF1722 family)/uncharacterized protein YbbK (DUF523 family)
MKNQVKPRVAVSQCLEFAACRWNGLKISSGVVKLLKPYVDFVPVCPEVEIGLGVPRPPIRLTAGDDGPRLVQSDTGLDHTDRMLAFAEKFLSELGEVDGFILKERSPSCGMKNVKLYPGPGKVQVLGSKHAGLFGAAVLEKYPGVPVEDEGRLRNFTLREHFLTALFTLARFRAARSAGRMAELVKFQERHKLILMAYDQVKMRALGRLIANPEKRPLRDVVGDYGVLLRQALDRPPQSGPVINVLTHALGYFKQGLLPAEKEFYLDALEQYRAERVPLGVPVAVVRSWIVRFDQAYLADQFFFAPYPEDLIEVTDSGKGREL